MVFQSRPFDGGRYTIELIDDDDDDSSSESMDDRTRYRQRVIKTDLQLIKENDFRVTSLTVKRAYPCFQNKTDEEWEEIGRDIADNTPWGANFQCRRPLDDQKMMLLFRGLTRSNTINYMDFSANGFSAAAVRSMVPFLPNASNLIKMILNQNNLLSEGFNVMLHALSNSPIKYLSGLQEMWH